MAMIAQKRLFDWQEIEELGDLARLKLVLDHLPDEELMRSLERRRGHGHNDYPYGPCGTLSWPVWCISIPASRACAGNCRVTDSCGADSAVSHRRRAACISLQPLRTPAVGPSGAGKEAIPPTGR